MQSYNNNNKEKTSTNDDVEESPAVVASVNNNKKNKSNTMKNGRYNNNNNHKHQSSSSSSISVVEEEEEEESLLLARKETRIINILRCVMFIVLMTIAGFAGWGVYYYKNQQEINNFISSYEITSKLIIDTFVTVVEKSLNAIDTMSTSITSIALITNQTFPYVTIPNFELHGCNLRIQCNTHIVHYMPIVTDTNREQWEEYSLENRFHIDDAYKTDSYYRIKQDKQFNINTDNKRRKQRKRSILERNNDENENNIEQRNITILDDGTNYHPYIWSSGAKANEPEGDIPIGHGPYLPLWQRSPISDKKQLPINQDLTKSRILVQGGLEIMQKEHVALLNPAMVPVPAIKPRLEANLKISQFREHVNEYVNDLSSFLTYPVFDSFDDDNKNVVGVLATNIYWKVLFSNVAIPISTKGIICIIRNSYNQTFAYRIDGNNDAMFLGMGIDPHDDIYDKYVQHADINTYLQSRANPINRAYTTVPLSQKLGKYEIWVYPSKETVNEYTSNNPIIYMIIIISIFFITSIIFILFNCYVERRQHVMMNATISAAKKIASTEQSLNEFLSHEVRNPLSAAMTACTFVLSYFDENCNNNNNNNNGTKNLSNDYLKEEEELKRIAREDTKVIDTSLRFINDFLRSMIDIHRADNKQLNIHFAPTDIYRDVLKPVQTMIFERTANFHMIIECNNNNNNNSENNNNNNLTAETDCLRLKQVILNLVRNASKFVDKGFIRLRTDTINGLVRIYVEDSGPGIPAEKRDSLFTKYNASLDLIGQGTGIGLALSKTLMTAMGGNIWLDETYNSGIEGSPGARFVVDLCVPPIKIKDDGMFYNDIESGAHAGDCCTKNNTTAVFSSESLSQQNKTTTINLDKVGVVEETETDSDLSYKELPENLNVLFVDDDAILRKLFIRAVKKVQSSWQIQEAASGEVALEICQSNKFDIIFLDQYMASVDKQLLGTEVCQLMRQKGINSIICGLSANDLEESFIKAGADLFIHKPMPCKKDELHQELSRIIHRRKGIGNNKQR